MSAFVLHIIYFSGKGKVAFFVKIIIYAFILFFSKTVPAAYYIKKELLLRTAPFTFTYYSITLMEVITG